MSGASDYIKKLRHHIGHELLLLPSAAGLIRNSAGEFLLQKRRDNLLWDIPGGMIDPGEQPQDACERELYEETGLQVRTLRIVHVFGGESMRITYPNKDVAEYTCVLFECEVVGGTVDVENEESLALQYFDIENVPTNITNFTKQAFNFLRKSSQ